MLGIDIGPWRLHVAKDAHLQNNGVDYGIFVMKYIEAIYYGRAPEFTVVCCTLKHYLLTYIIDYYIFIFFSFFRFFFQDNIPGFHKELCDELKDFLVEDDTKI